MNQHLAVKSSKARMWAAVGGILALAAMTTTAVAPAKAADAPKQQKKPNILIIWGDDIGQFNISAYNMGQMGYRTPNIDRR